MAISKVVQDSIDSTSTGVCRAWVNFNGTGTVAIRASFNVSSITDNGTGNYNINLTTALSDTNYVVNATCGRDPNVGGTDAPFCYMSDDGFAPTTSAFRILAKGAALSLQDQTRMFITVFR